MKATNTQTAIIIWYGLALSSAAGLITFFIAWCLSWGASVSGIVGLIVASSVFNRGKDDWLSFHQRIPHDSLRSQDSFAFFVRQGSRFWALCAAATLGYLFGAILVAAVPFEELFRNALTVLSTAPIVAHLVEACEVLIEILRQHVLNRIPPEHPGFGGAARYVAAFFFAKSAGALFDYFATNDEHIFRRGRSLHNRTKAQRLASQAATSAERTFKLGGVDVPNAATACHVCIVGATGSGKTKTMDFIMQEAVKTIGSGQDHRAIILDPKRDMIPKLYGMQVRCQVHVFNPFDLRCVRWDIARDCNSSATASQLAVTLAPSDEGPNRFFSDASQQLVTGAMLSLMRFTPEHWTLRDLILVLRKEWCLRQVLTRDAATADLCQYFREERTYQNIRSCLVSKISKYEPIAACWDRAEESLAMRDWISSESILVLGYDPSVREVLGTLNRSIYQRLCELLLSQPESATRQTWHFVDEVKELGRFDGLPRIATFGRGAGNRLVIGFQDIEGLRHVYGRELAHELTGQCGTKAILRVDSPETAAWAAKLIGDAEIVQRAASDVGVANAKDVLRHASISHRDIVLPGEILTLPATNRKNGLTGFYLSPFTGVFRSTLTPDEVDALLKPPATKWPGFMPRPPAHQILRDFDKNDYRRLKIEPER